MVFSPLLGVIAIVAVAAFSPGCERATKSLRWIAMAATLLPLCAVPILWANFDTGTAGYQLVEHFAWIRSFNIEYFVGIDGLSFPMVLLTPIVSFLCIPASFGCVKKQEAGYYALFLLLEAGMLGVFCALDFFLFYVFWEVMLLPMYFLIGIWGGPRKEYAAIKFFLYTLFGSVLMLLAIIGLYYVSGPSTNVAGEITPHTFSMVELAAQASILERAAPILGGLKFTSVVWIAFFIGFAIKIPMFPFHTWLPDAHVEAPTPVSVILAAILLKMGTYGILRVNFPILPYATAAEWASLGMAAFGVINIVYGAFCAMAQQDLKKLVAYSSISHMGFCLLGMASFTEAGMTGAVLQMFNHGTITAMLFLLVGVVYDRAHHRRIDGFGGLAKQTPEYAAITGFAFMAGLGLPGLSGFISEALCFLGGFKSFQLLTIVSASGVVITAAYFLWAMQRVHLGELNPKYAALTDVTWRERLTLYPFAVVIVVMGFYPMPLLERMQPSLDALARTLASIAAAAPHGM